MRLLRHSGSNARTNGAVNEDSTSVMADQCRVERTRWMPGGRIVLNELVGSFVRLRIPKEDVVEG